VRYYLSSIVWGPPTRIFGDGPLLEVIGMFARKRMNCVEIDDRKDGQFMNSTLASLHGVFKALDEVADLLKMAETHSPIALDEVTDPLRMTSSKIEGETHSLIALDEVTDNLRTTSSEIEGETHSLIALDEVTDNLRTTSSEIEGEGERTHALIASPIAGNFIFTDLMAGHFNKDFVTKIDSFHNDPEIQSRYHAYLNICYEMHTIYKKGIRAVLKRHDYKYIPFLLLYLIVTIIVTKYLNYKTAMLTFGSSVTKFPDGTTRPIDTINTSELIDWILDHLSYYSMTSAYIPEEKNELFNNLHWDAG